MMNWKKYHGTSLIKMSWAAGVRQSVVVQEMLQPTPAAEPSLTEGKVASFAPMSRKGCLSTLYHIGDA